MLHCNLKNTHFVDMEAIFPGKQPFFLFSGNGIRRNSILLGDLLTG
jgi:hypothetical protein